MFFYFPVKSTDGTVVGSIRAEHGKATLLLRRPIDAECFLFADGRSQSIRPDEAVPADRPEALLGIRHGKTVLFGSGAGVRKSSSDYLAILSRNRTKIVEQAATIRESESRIREDSPQASAVLGVNISQASEPMHPSEPEESPNEDPTETRAKSVFSRLEALLPYKPESADGEEEFGQSVLKSVHASHPSSESFSDMVQKEDVSVGSTGTDALFRVSHSDAGLPKIELFSRIFPGATWRFVAKDASFPHFEGHWEHGGEHLLILAVRGTYAPQPPKGLSGFTRFLRSDGAGYWVRILPDPLS